MKKQYFGLALLVTLGFTSVGLTGCGEDGPGSLLPLDEVCVGLECKTMAEAGGSVSGIADIDAFFTAVVNFNAQAGILEADVNATLGELAAAAGAEVGASADITAANIAAEIEGGFDGQISGGLKIEYQAPKCEVSAKATVQAAAKCDAEVDPGSVKAECKGSCEAEASAMASCEGTVKCTGTAPSFECSGTCEGECQLEAGASCEGTCKGSCELDGSVACDGECAGSTDAGGNCTGECKVRSGGKCEGECKGSCELSAGASCTGQCKGECTYDPPEGGCTGKASCEASADAKVSCEGECKGEVVPPKVKAECEASVKAEADFQAECSPPQLAVTYELAASLQGEANVAARAEFEAKIAAFAKAYGNLVAKGAKLELVLNAGKGIAAAAEVAVKGGLESFADGDASFIVKFQAVCALDALPAAGKMIGDATDKVQGSVAAVASVTGAISG